MHQAPGLVKQAVSAGVVSSAAVLDGGLSVLDESRTNQVHVVTVDAVPVAFAKQRGWAAHADGDDPVAAEKRALSMLAKSGLVPRLLPVDSPDVLWTEALHPCTVVYELLRNESRGRQITAARAWGQALAALHRWPTRFGSAPIADRPWIFTPDETPAHLAAAVEGSEVDDVLRELRGNPLIRHALDSAADSWAARHWIHGDAGTANAVARSLGPYQWRVWLVDLGGAGLGDPTWDLVTAYDSIEFHGLTHGRDVRSVLAGLVDGYRSAGGPARLTRAALIARAALTAVQFAAAAAGSGATNPTSRSAPFLRRVCSLAAAEPAPCAAAQSYLPSKSRRPAAPYPVEVPA
jgi:aminoglycoside phosphotransferase